MIETGGATEERQGPMVPPKPSRVKRKIAMFQKKATDLPKQEGAAKISVVKSLAKTFEAAEAPSQEATPQTNSQFTALKANFEPQDSAEKATPKKSLKETWVKADVFSSNTQSWKKGIWLPTAS